MTITLKDAPAAPKGMTADELLGRVGPPVRRTLAVRDCDGDVALASAVADRRLALVYIQDDLGAVVGHPGELSRLEPFVEVDVNIEVRGRG